MGRCCLRDRINCGLGWTSSKILVNETTSTVVSFSMILYYSSTSISTDMTVYLLGSKPNGHNTLTQIDLTSVCKLNVGSSWWVRMQPCAYCQDAIIHILSPRIASDKGCIETFARDTWMHRTCQIGNLRMVSEARSMHPCFWTLEGSYVLGFCFKLMEVHSWKLIWPFCGKKIGNIVLELCQFSYLAKCCI